MKKILLLFFIFYPFIYSYSSDWSDVVKEVKPSIGKIIVQDHNGNIHSQGSGFVIRHEEKQLLITNAHVVSSALEGEELEIIAEFPSLDEHDKNTITRELSLIRYDKDIDIALFSMDEDLEENLILGQSNPPLMSELVVIGYPLGESFKVTPGFLQAYQEVSEFSTLMDISSTLAPGNSGGPVLNPRGEVIGIATSTIMGYNFNFAISLEDVLFFLNEGAITISISLDSNPADALLFINEEYRGKTPLLLELYNREYSLRLEKSGYQVLETSIGPWSDEQVRITEALDVVEIDNPIISIITEPIGADIFVNNRFIGVSPVSISMPRGRILRIQASNGRSRVRENYPVTDESDQEVLIKIE